MRPFGTARFAAASRRPRNVADISMRRLLLSFARPHRRRLLAILAVLLVESAAALSIPLMGGALAESVTGGAAGTAIHLVLAVLIGVLAAQALLRAASAYLLDEVVDRLVAELRQRLYDHLQALPLAFHQQRRMGDSLALLTHDAYAISAFITGTAVTIVPLLATAAGAGLLMARIRVDLAALVVLLLPLFYLAAKLVGRRMRPLAVALQEEEASAVALAQENLALLPVIKSFTREKEESSRFRAQLDRILALAGRQRRIQAAFGPAMHFAAAAGLVLVFALATGTSSAALSAGELVTFLLYAHLLARPVAGLADVYGQTQGVRGAVQRIGSVFGEAVDTGGTAAMPRVRGEIELREVSFAFPGRRAALDRVSLRIEAGEHVALVGPNGSGKSTLAQLLLRLHEPQSGKIAIDGIDVRTVSLASLRAQVGIVPQQVMLFNASIRENIACGRSGCAEREIEAAARAACAHDFIVQLPQGYATVVGDAGVRLSGGQQQRLALARALLKDPAILMLDEATSMFDPEGEAEFLRIASRALAGRTVIFITHRASSLRDVERTIQMRDGRVMAAAVAPGPRRRLPAANGH